MATDRLLDQAGLHILNLAKQTGLSSPAISERVRRMEAAGYIKAHRSVVDYEKLGFPITAFIRISIQPERADEADETLQSIPEVLEAHHLTGVDSLIMKVAATSVGNLEEVINRVSVYGQTTTSIVLSSPVT